MADKKGHNPNANTSANNDRGLNQISRGDSGWTGGGVSNFGNAADKKGR